MQKRVFIIHPILFAILPIVSLLSFNIDMVSPQQAIHSLLISLAATAVFFLLLNFLIQNWIRTGIITSLCLIFFFSYGHIYGGFVHPATQSIFQKLGLMGRHDLLLITWSALLGIAIWITGRLKHFSLEITQFLNIMGVIGLISPVYQIAAYELRLQQPWTYDRIDISHVDQQTTGTLPVTPDIYYLILDGYGSSDILMEDYKYDNTSFIQFLQERGFFIAQKSRSNYLQTSLSLASSLNMEYLDFLSQQMGAGSDRLPSARLIRWNEVESILKSRGYSTVAFQTGYRVTELDNADYYLHPSRSAATIFDRLVLDTSGLVLLQEIPKWLDVPPFYPGYKAHRDNISFAFENLERSAQIPGPKFVFAHIIAPHPPFVFQANGDPVEPNQPFYFLDGSAYIGSTDDYVKGYQAQIQYVNRKMRTVIEEILRNSTQPPIIVVQGDHGPGSTFNWENPDEHGLRERSSILNAYYLAGFSKLPVYDEISPVNTFRLIFNEFLGGSYPLLPDRTLYSGWEHPYLFEDID